jgi:hypothetical protein
MTTQFDSGCVGSNDDVVPHEAVPNIGTDRDHCKVSHVARKTEPVFSFDDGDEVVLHCHWYPEALFKSATEINMRPPESPRTIDNTILRDTTVNSDARPNDGLGFAEVEFIKEVSDSINNRGDRAASDGTIRPRQRPPTLV